jgi:ferredoxin-NADP reductase
MNEADLKLAATDQAGDFSSEQKRYLEGFVAGVQIAKAAKSVAGAATVGGAAPAPEPTGPDAAGLKAQSRVLASGGKLSDPEKFKREQHPFDTYERLKEHAAKGEYPKPPDNFRWRFFGLFYVAPNQNSYMCRLRIPNGILKSAQLAGLADLAERYGGGYAHVTTRANLQIREVEAHNAVAMIEAIQDLGLCSRGSGADNIRNVTGTPTAGIDPQELIDTRPYAREWHFHILNDRSLYGLPRKFNVAFDGAGVIPVLEDTNDIGFQAVHVNRGFGLEPGVWFKLCLGSITGHHDFARDTGVLVQPKDTCKVADAVVRIFIDHGDRTDRTKARLKYVLDVLAALHKFPGIRPDPEAFIEALDPLQPRVYSISSLHRCTPGRVSLTVDAVRYEIDRRTRLGVCSTFVGGRIAPGDKTRVYVQKAQHFALPDDPSKPIIMIGPGTGVAPFRAFLHERQATKAPGRNWLFFGHQRSSHDFFYEEEPVAMRAAGHLTRLTLAWSRNGNEKVYVQHRMREVGRDLWSWLNDGAHVYVCGDALRMAKDVEAALIEIVAQHGGHSPAAAAKFVADLKTQGRYQADVY